MGGLVSDHRTWRPARARLREPLRRRPTAERLAVARKTGEIRWAGDSDWPYSCHAAGVLVANGIVYASVDGAGPLPPALLCPWSEELFPIGVDGPLAFGGTTDHTFAAFDSLTGSLLWGFDLPYTEQPSRTLKVGSMLLADDDENLYGFDPASGSRSLRRR